MLKICGGKFDQDQKQLAKEPDEDLSKEKFIACRERLAPYIIDPNNFYKVMWDVLVGFIYLSVFLFDPFIFAFKYEPLRSKQWLMTTTRLLTTMIVIDMFLTPLTAIVREESMNDDNKSKGKYKKYAVTTSNDK